MRWMSHFGVWLVLLVLCKGSAAQSALEAGLRALPISVGENVTVTRGAGESWVDIGIRERVGYEHLRRANRGNFASARRIFIPGRHQARGLVENGLVINLPELMNFQWRNGRIVGWYPISIGRVASRWRTPLGELHVINRVEDPVWHRPSWAGGGEVPPGPRNPLGDRWIGLNRPGYGLHGTNDPTSIGRMVSHGCIRHFPPHIHQVFDAIRVGMPVILTYDTVTVGHDGGIVYMAVFEDIYARGTNAPRNARKRLASYRLEGALTGHQLEQRLAQADGVARPLLGSHIRVVVNLTALDTPIGPTRRDGVTYLPLRPLANAINAQVIWNNESKTTTLTRLGRRVILTGENASFTALGSQFIPVRSVVEGLGGGVSFTPSRITIRIL